MPNWKMMTNTPMDPLKLDLDTFFQMLGVYQLSNCSFYIPCDHEVDGPCMLLADCYGCK